MGAWITNSSLSQAAVETTDRVLMPPAQGMAASNTPWNHGFSGPTPLVG